MKYYFALIAFFASLFLPVVTQAAIAIEELEEFGQKIYDIHANQSKAEFLDLLHPDCPAPIMAKVNHQFSKKWLTEEVHDIRIKNPSDSFDMNKFDFKVMPEGAIEIQTWTQGDSGDKAELVTVYAVTKYKGVMKIIEPPCYDFKQ